MTSPVGRFAWELRALRDRMGVSALTVDQISAREGIPRSTLYAALSGHRLPRREVVAVLARQWGGDEVALLAKRSEVEQLASSRPLPERHKPGLGPESVRVLRATAEPEFFAARTALMRAGEPADGVMLIEDGVVKVVAAIPGSPTAVLGLRGTGELVGEMAALEGKLRTATVVATTPVTVSRIDTNTFTDLLGRHPSMMMELLRILSTRLDDATQQQLDVATGSSGRVLSYLRLLGERHGSPMPDGSLQVPRFLTQQELAGTLGISSASLARALRDLRTSGKVTIHRDEILVHPRS